MKLYIAILSIGLGSFFVASGMTCGGVVTKKIAEESTYIRETVTQRNEKEQRYLFISRRENKETKKLSYSGIIGDLLYDDKTASYEIFGGMNQTWLGDSSDSTSKDYQALEDLWSELNSQVVLVTKELQ